MTGVGRSGPPAGTSPAARPPDGGAERPAGAVAATSGRRPGEPGDGLLAVAVAVGLLIALPVLVLVGRSIVDGALGDAVRSPDVVDALALSLVTTACSLVLTVVLGLPLALVLARRRFRGSALLETVVDLPVVLPPSVAGLALLLAFGRRGLLGDPLAGLGLVVPFTTAAVVVAQTFVAAPFFIRSAKTGFMAVDRDVEDAARVDGASERHLFRRVTLPLASSALAAGLVMSWARALGEFGATIMFAGNIPGRTQTLPLVVYADFQGGDLESSIAAAAVLVLAAFGVLAAVRVFHWGRALDVRTAA